MIPEIVAHRRGVAHKRWLPQLGLMLLVWAALTSCRGPEPDTSYLDGTPCAVPCWQGITPGVTDEGTLLEIISDPDLAEQDSISKGTSQEDPSRVVYRFRSSAGSRVEIGVRNGIAIWIRLGPGYDLTLNRVVETLGEPDQVYVEEGDDTHLGHCYAVELFYVTKGTWFRSGACIEGSEYELTWDERLLAQVSSEMTVTFQELLIPGSDLELFLAGMPTYHPGKAHYVASHASPWVGFGFYPLSPMWQYPNP